MNNNPKLSAFFRRRPYLVWGTNASRLSVPAALEVVLNYGDLPDIRAFVSVVGRTRVKRTFRTALHKTRSNYRPEVRDFFRAVW